jgi:hypothetical protein
MTIGIEYQGWKFSDIPRGVALFLASIFTVCRLFGAGAAPGPRIGENLHKLPLTFEKNQGQAHQSVDFLARGGRYSVFLSHGNVRIALRHDKSAAPVAVCLRLIGANRHPQVATRDALPGRVNYFCLLAVWCGLR